MYKIRLYSQPDISTAFQSQYQLKSKHADFYPVNIWFRCYYRALTFSEHAKSNKNHASYVDTGRPQSRYPMIQIDLSFPRIKIESNSKLKKKIPAIVSQYLSSQLHSSCDSLEIRYFVFARNYHGTPDSRRVFYYITAERIYDDHETRKLRKSFSVKHKCIHII